MGSCTDSIQDWENHFLMLNQLNRLAIETDGRYASVSELKFVKDYLASIDLRISAYEKIRDAEDQIVDHIETQLKSHNPKFFQKGKQDYSDICRRDRKSVLRLSTTAMLFADLDSLRDGFLLWYRTIIKAFKDEKAAQVTYKLLPAVVTKVLTPEENKLIEPTLELSRSILGE